MQICRLDDVDPAASIVFCECSTNDPVGELEAVASQVAQEQGAIAIRRNEGEDGHSRKYPHFDIVQGYRWIETVFLN